MNTYAATSAAMITTSPMTPPMIAPVCEALLAKSAEEVGLCEVDEEVVRDILRLVGMDEVNVEEGMEEVTARQDGSVPLNTVRTLDSEGSLSSDQPVQSCSHVNAPLCPVLGLSIETRTEKLINRVALPYVGLGSDIGDVDCDHTADECSVDRVCTAGEGGRHRGKCK